MQLKGGFRLVINSRSYIRSKRIILKNMSTFFQIDSNFAIEGEVNESSLKHLKEKFNSVLYLCPDAGSDKG